MAYCANQTGRAVAHLRGTFQGMRLEQPHPTSIPTLPCEAGQLGASLLDVHGFEETRCEEYSVRTAIRGRQFSGRPSRKRGICRSYIGTDETIEWKRPWEGLEAEEIESRCGRTEFSFEGNAAGTTINVLKRRLRDCVLRTDLDQRLRSLRGQSSRGRLLFQAMVWRTPGHLCTRDHKLSRI